MSSASESTTRRRVKLYVLNKERQWDDRGTGHVTSTYVDDSNSKGGGISLLVLAETNGSALLESKIQPDTAYQKQQDTLIVWAEGDNLDLALSFQEKAGCDEIWEKICQVQGKDPSVTITQDIVDESEEEHFDEISDSSSPIELPPCELSRLDEIGDLISNVLPSPVGRENLSLAIENENYVRKLVDLFYMCEDLENTRELHTLYSIFRNLFMLNKNSLLEIMLTDDLIMDIVGILEYDPKSSVPQRHRDYLRETAKFQEVIPIASLDLLNKIHQTYRVQYIQDVILPTPSVFEENMLSSLSSFVFFNKVEIVQMIQENEKLLSQILSQLTDESVDDNKRKLLVGFLKEFCSFSQTLQPTNRELLFKSLSSLGILRALEFVLGMEDTEVLSSAIDIFAYFVEFNPSMVRDYMMQEATRQDDENSLLIASLIELMASDNDPELGNAVQIMGLLRVLLDPENMLASITKSEKTEFLTFFYKHAMHLLTAPILASTADDDGPAKDEYQMALLQSLILELLMFCVEHHTYHIRSYILSKDFLRRVLILLKSTHKFLVLCALRFMRRMIGLKDEFYNRYVMKGKLFQPVVNAFLKNGSRYNMINSAILEMFEFIRMEDVRSLCAHIIENYGTILDSIDYVQTFSGLRLRFEQQKERLANSGSIDNIPAVMRNSRYRRDPRGLDEDEEIWFNEDDEDDDESTVPLPETDESIKPTSDTDTYSRLLMDKKKEFIPAVDELETFGLPTTQDRISPPLPAASRHSAGSPTPTLSTSPSPPGKNNNQNGMSAMATKVGLVDYEGDSDDDENDDDTTPPSKRPRLGS